MSAGLVPWTQLRVGDIVQYRGRATRLVRREGDVWHGRTVCGKPVVVHPHANPETVMVARLFEFAR